MQASETRYLPEIDGLRAIAVVSVVAFHAGVPWLPGGFTGVDVFFVISGFLITGLLLEEQARTGRIALGAFWARRVRRLLPALALVLVVTLAAASVWLSPVLGEIQGVARSALAQLLLVANVHFALVAGDYFGPAAEAQPLLHLWSLAVEEQFYLLWPLLLSGAAMLGMRAGWKAERALGGVLWGVTIASLVLCVVLTMHQPIWAFYLMPTRAWELGAGALLALLVHHQALPRAGGAMLPVGLVLIAAGFLVLEQGAGFPGWRALLPVAGAVFVIWGIATGRAGSLGAVLRSRPMVWLGLISYPLYLWHWPLLSIARTARLEALTAWELVALCAVAVLLAHLTWVGLERPLRQMGRGWSVKRTLAGGGVALASVASLALAVGLWARIMPEQDPEQARLRALLLGERSVWHDVPCQPPVAARAFAEHACLLGGGDGRADTLLWGDSHAGHLWPALESAAAQSGRRVLMRFMSECPPIPDYDPAAEGVGRARECVAFNDAVLSETLADPGVATVFLSARWTSYVRSDAERARLIAVTARLREAGKQVIVVAPGPSFAHPAPECLLRLSARSCGLPRAVVEGQRAAFLRALDDADAGGMLSILDPLPILCGAERCEVLGQGMLLYSDSHHFTVAASRMISGEVVRLLEPLG